MALNSIALGDLSYNDNHSNLYCFKLSYLPLTSNGLLYSFLFPAVISVRPTAQNAFLSVVSDKVSLSLLLCVSWFRADQVIDTHMLRQILIPTSTLPLQYNDIHLNILFPMSPYLLILNFYSVTRLSLESFSLT